MDYTAGRNKHLYDTRSDPFFEVLAKTSPRSCYYKATNENT